MIFVYPTTFNKKWCRDTSSYSNKIKETKKKKRKKCGKVNNDYYYEDKVFNIYLDGLTKLLDMEERLSNCNSTINTLH